MTISTPIEKFLTILAIATAEKSEANLSVLLDYYVQEMDSEEQTAAVRVVQEDYLSDADALESHEVFAYECGFYDPEEKAGLLLNFKKSWAAFTLMEDLRDFAAVLD